MCVGEGQILSHYDGCDRIITSACAILFYFFNVLIIYCGTRFLIKMMMMMMMIIWHHRLFKYYVISVMAPKWFSTRPRIIGPTKLWFHSGKTWFAPYNGFSPVCLCHPPCESPHRHPTLNGMHNLNFRNIEPSEYRTFHLFRNIDFGT